MNPPVRIAVAGDFMALRGDVSYELRIPLCYSFQHEESPSDAKLFQDGEQFVSVRLHT